MESHRTHGADSMKYLHAAKNRVLENGVLRKIKPNEDTSGYEPFKNSSEYAAIVAQQSENWYLIEEEWCREVNQILTDRISLLKYSKSDSSTIKAWEAKHLTLLEYQSDVKARLPNLTRPSI